MEDYILREIDKIGVIIAAILSGFVARKQSDEENRCEYAMTELADKLDLDFDILLESDDTVALLTERYGFNNDNLDRFAELLYEFVLASNDRKFTDKCIVSIGSIYRYLNNTERSASFKRYDIIKELERYSR